MNQELTPEQQQVVDEAAKEHAQNRWAIEHSLPGMNGLLKRLKVEASKQDFKAGVTFALSTPSLYMGLMEEFAEFIMKNYFEDEYQGGIWYDKNGGMVTTAELVTKFIEHKNKKE